MRTMKIIHAHLKKLAPHVVFCDDSSSLWQDYCEVIREPMDLSKIRKRLRNGHYVTPNAIIRDVRLIFSNANTYNAKGTVVSCCTITSSLHHRYCCN